MRLVGRWGVWGGGGGGGGGGGVITGAICRWFIHVLVQQF